MARIVVVGGSVLGLCTAMLLARDGHDVTVFERDPAPPPDPNAAWDDWERRGVNQFRLLHYLQPRFRELMDAHLPEVSRALDDAGALRFNPLRLMPDEFSGGWRDGDERNDALTTRRPVAESAIARVAAATDHLEVRRGVAIAGLLTGEPVTPGVPHVIGVRTEDGEEVRADYVIDAAGRRSTLPTWLTTAGARSPVEEKAECGFVYYGRHFRSSDGSIPAMIGPLLQDFGTFSVLTLPADNGTWGIGAIASSKDPALRALKNVDVWERVIKSCPLLAHWLDGEPLDENVLVMAKIEDRHRSFVVDGAPVATGVFAVADSWACTNPSVGRGISIGAIHAVALRNTLHDAPTDAVATQLAWYDTTMATVEPWYRGTLAFDDGRLAEVDALLEGRELEADPGFEIVKAMQMAAGADPDVLRVMLGVAGVLELPEEALARPGIFERIIEHGANWREQEILGPTREELIALTKS